MTSNQWTPFQKVGFRFSFIFFLSFIFIVNNNAFPLFHYINRSAVQIMHQITPWFAEHILSYQYDHRIFTNGSGDTSYDWITLLIILLWSIIGAVVWSIIDRAKKNYDVGYYWLATFIRYYVAFMLTTYGVTKLAHAQMPPPGLNRLMQPLGDFSPMGLAWTYFGYSKGYNILIGIVEVSTGLLLFRKSMVLGALLTVGVSINVMAVNYFFDVPVKIMSTALLLMAIFLLLPYFRILFDFLLRSEYTRLISLHKPKFDKKWKDKTVIVTKVVVLSLFVLQQAIGITDRKKIFDQYYKKSPMYGIYRIDSIKDTSATIPKEWSYIIFQYEGEVNVRDRYYEVSVVNPMIDTAEQKISLNNHTFDYSILENGDILLKKTFGDRIEEVKFIKQDPGNFELMKRKFNWIQEYPYNR